MVQESRLTVKALLAAGLRGCSPQLAFDFCCSVTARDRLGLDLGLSNVPVSRPVFGFLWVDLVVTRVSLPGAGRSELPLDNAW